MKALNIHELRTFAQSAQDVLKNGRLQEVWVNDRGLALGFFQNQMQWLVIDLVQNTPLVLLFTEHPVFQKSSKSKPVSLFLNAHAKNLFFDSCEVLEQWGRVLLVTLSGGDKRCEIEVHLVPKQVNLIVRVGDKSISWSKVRELKPAMDIPEMEERSLRCIRDEWVREQKVPQKGTAQDPIIQWQSQKLKELQKKSKALGEIENILGQDRSSEMYKAGEHLKIHGFKNLDDKWLASIDQKKNISWNIENVFHKAKQFEQKKIGTLLRKEKIIAEILALENSRYQARTKKAGLDDLMKKVDAKGRKLYLASGMIVYCGKSAKDNLTLLRQAKSWDFWLHLKDFPGAHAIVHRQKDQQVSEKEIQQVGVWLATESLAAKSLIAGERLAVVMAECRYVKPIKGDKLGRVTYHSEKNFVIIY